MKQFLLALFIAGAACGHAQSVVAKEATAKVADAKAPVKHHLDDATLEAAVALLPPPTTPGSAADMADRHLTEEAYLQRSAEQAALAKAEESFNVFAFSRVLGNGFNANKLPATAALFESVKKEVAIAKNAAKERWKRERPCPVNSCQWDPEDDAKDWQHRDFGYPSGHATRGMVYAVLLDELLPARKPAIDAYAEDAAWRRVVRGVHTEQDVMAGRVLGLALARAYLANPAFRKEFEGVARELEGAGFNRAASTTAKSR